MVNYVISNAKHKLDIFNELVDPASTNIDHKSHPGIAMILSPSAINKLRNLHQQITYLEELDILLEPTKFGVAISGIIPNHLGNNAGIASANFIAARPVSNQINQTVPETTQKIQPSKLSSLGESETETIAKENFQQDSRAYNLKGKAKSNLILSDMQVDYVHWLLHIISFLIRLMITSVNIGMYILVALINISCTLGTIVLRPNAPKVNVKWPKPFCKSKKSKILQLHMNMDNFSHTANISKSNSKVRCLITSHYHKPRLKSQRKVYWNSHTENNYTTLSSKNANYLHNSTCLFLFIILYLIYHTPLSATGILLGLIVFSQQQFQFPSFHTLTTFNSSWKFCCFIKLRTFISKTFLDNEMRHSC